MATPMENFNAVSKAICKEEKMATPMENFNAASKVICEGEKMATPMENFTAASKAIGGKEKKVPISKASMELAQTTYLNAVTAKVDSRINECYKPRKSTVKIKNQKIDLSKIQGKFIAWRKTQMQGGGVEDHLLSRSHALRKPGFDSDCTDSSGQETELQPVQIVDKGR
jgi:hypothetical protein